MRVSKEEAVAVCQEFGFATADGWSEDKLTKKLGELVTLYRTGEFSPDDGDVVVILSRLGKKENAGKEITIGDDEEDLFVEDVEEDEGLESEMEVEENEEEAIKARCPRSVGDRVVVREEGCDEWKGIVDEILSDTSILVRARDGQTWETTVDRVEVKLRAAEVEKKSSKKTTIEKAENPKSGEEDEIRSLRERINALKSKQKKSGKAGPKRKLQRDEIAVHVLKAHPEGGIMERLAEEVDERWKKQGRRENLEGSLATLKRVVKAGVLFGLLEVVGRMVTWTSTE